MQRPFQRHQGLAFTSDSLLYQMPYCGLLCICEAYHTITDDYKKKKSNEIKKQNWTIHCSVKDVSGDYAGSLFPILLTCGKH